MQLVLGLMDDQRLEAAERHLQQCPDCIDRLRAMAVEDSMSLALNSVRDVLGKLNPLNESIIRLLADLSNSDTLNAVASIEDTTLVPPDLQSWGETSLAPGTVLGNYILEDRIGQGGMGEVFKARHRRMDRVVAIKVLSANLTRNEEAISRFHREVKAVAQLNHPHVVTAYDADEADGIHFLVMEYIEGASLMSLVATSGPLRISQAVECVIQAARGLACAHERGIVHRDIKPANLLLTEPGVVKVLDLGLARIGETTESPEIELTQAGVVMGTVDFMAPEQALDARRADPRADIYSLGCTLYFLLTGRTLFKGDTPMQKLVAHREQPIPSLCAVRTEIPEALDAVLARMLAKNPEVRYPSMSAVIAALEPFSLSAATPVLPGRGRGFLRRTIVLAGAAACLLLAMIVFKLKTADGTLILQIDPADADVEIASHDGRVELTRRGEPGGAGAMTIAVVQGKHRLQVEKAGFQIFTEEFSTNWGNQSTITAKLVPLVPKEADITKGETESTKVAKENIMSSAADRDRRAAEWVLRVQGKLKISCPGESEREISRLVDLPSQPFHVTSVIVDQGVNSTVTDSDLSILNGLQELRTLSLHHLFKVSDQGLKRIHGLGNLEVLMLGFVRDDGTAEGFAHLLKESPKLRVVHFREYDRMHCLHPLPALLQLTELSLYSDLKDDGMARIGALGNLSSLLVNVSSISQQGLTPLTKLQKLQKLQLVSDAPEGARSAPIEDGTVKTLSRLEQLEQFLIYARPDEVKLTDAGMEHLKALKNLKIFQVRAPLLTDASLKTLSEVKGLHQVALVGSPLITDAGLKSLASLPALQSLALFTPLITDDGFEHLREFRELISIKLASSRISSTGLEQIVGTLNSRIEYLGLPYTDVTDTGIVHLQRLRQLRVVDLAGTRISDGAIEHFEKMTKLTSLDLQGTAVTEPAVAKLKTSLPLCTIRWSPKTPEHWTAMQGVRLGGKVQMLQLASEQITELSSPLALETSFNGRKIFDMPGLCVWGINWKGSSRLTDADLQDLRGLKRIEHLDLSDTKITDVGLAHIAGLKTLRTLGLQGTRVTDRGLSYLSALSNLRSLSLTNSQITDSGLAMIRSALPKCTITR